MAAAAAAIADVNAAWRQALEDELQLRSGRAQRLLAVAAAHTRAHQCQLRKLQEAEAAKAAVAEGASVVAAEVAAEVAAGGGDGQGQSADDAHASAVNAATAAASGRAEEAPALESAPEQGQYQHT